MTGTQALVRLPMLQQVRDEAAGLDTACMISGYRGSPLGNFDRALWQARPFIEKHGVHFMPGVNEDTAATALWGTQQVGLFPGAKHDGVFAIWYGKGPGVDRTMDVFKHANLAGTAPHGGVLALAGDDHVCASSTTAHQSEFDFMSATMPVINPAGVQEFLDYGLHGWGLSRYAGLWVGFICIAETVDSSAIVSVDPHRVTILTPDDHELPEGGLNIRWPDTPLAMEERLLEHKLDAARAYARANGLDRSVIDGPGRRLGIVTHRQVLPRRAPGAGRPRHRRRHGAALRHRALQGRHELAAGARRHPQVRRRARRDTRRRGEAGLHRGPDQGAALQPARERAPPRHRHVRRGGAAAAPRLGRARPRRPLRRRSPPGSCVSARTRASRRAWRGSGPSGRRPPPPSLRRWSACPTSAPAARTTRRPRYRRGAARSPASAATTWCSGWTGRPTPTPTWAAKARTGSGRRPSPRPSTSSRTSATAPTSTPASSPSAPPSPAASA